MLNLVPEHTYNRKSRDSHRNSNTPGPSSPAKTFSWLVVPYHPALYRQGLGGIAARLSAGIASPDSSLLVKIAWARGFPNLEQRTAKLFKRVFMPNGR